MPTSGPEVIFLWGRGCGNTKYGRNSHGNEVDRYKYYSADLTVITPDGSLNSIGQEKTRTPHLLFNSPEEEAGITVVIWNSLKEEAEHCICFSASRNGNNTKCAFVLA
jgi:hypothetical protein